MNTIPMSCPKCNAPINVPLEIDQISCINCGTALLIEKGDGYAALKIAAVQRNKDISDSNIQTNPALDIGSQTTHNELAITCPVCHLPDKIQKVESILKDGVRRTKSSGPSGGAAFVNGKFVPIVGTTTSESISITALAQQLSPPPPPKPDAFGACGTLFFIGLLFLGSMIVLSFFFAFISGARWTADVLLYLIIGTGCFLGFNWYQNERREHNAAYPLKKAAWDSAMKRWNDLYYCYRNDVIFDPATGETDKPQNIGSFIYSKVPSTYEVIPSVSKENPTVSEVMPSSEQEIPAWLRAEIPEDKGKQNPREKIQYWGRKVYQCPNCQKMNNLLDGEKCLQCGTGLTQADIISNPFF